MEMLTIDDVWGKREYVSKGVWRTVIKGMLVAMSGDICPVWGDELPHKSATFICEEDQIEEVNKWIRYVQGQGYSKKKKLPDGRIALRSDYSVLLW